MKLIKPNIVIIGCGSLGGRLAQLVAADSKNIGLKFLYLVDFDNVEEENEPYKMLKIKEQQSYFKINKAHSLAEYLKCYKQRIFPIPDIFPECIERKPVILKDAIVVDCRDTNETDSRCHIKANFDGSYYRIIVNPTNCKGERNEYVLYDSHIVPMKTAIRIIDIMTNEKLLNSEKNTVFYYSDGREYTYQLNKDNNINGIHIDRNIIGIN